MAIRVPIISDFEDRGIKSATAAFSKFKADIAKADGAVNKFKAGTSAAFGALQTNAVAFGAAAGAALATFAAKAVLSYKDLGLAVGKFADATGVTTEQASRLIEVTGDLNIESSSLETALNKLNRAAAEGASGFKAIGAEIARTSTGAVDVNQTFLNVIDGLNSIQDPAVRARVATELLGKGWRDLAVVIEGGSRNLKKSLESVSGAKIYSSEQVAQTRRLEAAFKNLQDVGEDFAQSVGRALTPAVIEAVEAITDMLNAVKDVSDFEMFGVRVGDMATFLARFTANGFNAIQTLRSYRAETTDARQITEQMAAAIREGADAMTRGRLESEATARQLVNLALSTDRVSASWDNLKASLNIQDTMSQANQKVDEFIQKWLGAMASGKVSAEEFQGDLLGIKLYLLDVAEQVGITKSVFLQNQFRILVDTSQIERAIALLNSISEGGELSYDFYYSGNALMSQVPFMASGGIVSSPTLAVIGEAGPEAVIPLDRLGSMGNVTVNVSGSVVTETDLIESIRKGLANSQRNGSQLVYSNT
jgi:hypothetical protein